MNHSLGNLLALVLEGHLSVSSAKGAAAALWINGAIKADELPMFEAEIQKARAEQNLDRYAESVAQRRLEDIDRILNSPHLHFNAKERIRAHPKVKRKQAAAKRRQQRSKKGKR